MRRVRREKPLRGDSREVRGTNGWTGMTKSNMLTSGWEARPLFMMEFVCSTLLGRDTLRLLLCEGRKTLYRLAYREALHAQGIFVPPYERAKSLRQWLERQCWQAAAEVSMACCVCRR